MDAACVNRLGMCSCILVTFPLVFGWMYFTMDDNGYYNIIMLGMQLMAVKADGIIANFSYNALNISATMVIAGVCMALYRRLKNMQARAEQKFIYDFFRLYILFLYITGLAYLSKCFCMVRTASNVIDPSIVCHRDTDLSAIWKACAYSFPSDECISKKLPGAL